MKVTIRRQLSSQKRIYENVRDSYQKGDMYCLYLENGNVVKIPIVHIFDIEESY